MIRYLAYYSFGGYKDMMLGLFDNDASGSSKDNLSNYYSPFLKPWLEGTLTDIDQRTIEQLNSIKEEGRIEIIGRDSSYSMPNTARKIATHGGYRLLCCSLEDGTYSVALRDITNDVRDEFGRPVPFMMQFVVSDVKQADSIADYFRDNIIDVRIRLGKLFSFNPQLNCLQFSVSEANRLVTEALTSTNSERDPSNCRKIRLATIPQGMNISFTVKELGLTLSDIIDAFYDNGEKIHDTISDRNTAFNDTSIRMDSSDSPLQLLYSLRGIRFTDEDKEDLKQIKTHIKAIIKRHKS